MEVLLIVEISKLHKITNHPVHIFDEDGTLSPSAFIPFCQFAENISAMGRESNLFKIPVCNSFQAKISYDHLCYEVDIHEVLGREFFKSHELQLGLSLLIDTNFNRQYTLQEKVNTKETIGR